ncbi:hypothetical protein [Aliiroseovarius sp. PrR006]|uniref:hypothetical protein n=1 Tax=Aliiroseovarius sp. PrR006 TaxID=2706883 RepID=UPI0013D28298|nr:hypothetical protein [Aliiroseovarius sp. PrR006]NDW53537.1 hypothetical protein [Aliiroseovarius sp. PrR006]
MDLVPALPGGWNVSVVDTAPRAMSSGRIRRLKEWLKPGPFMVTYSDGLGNININALIELKPLPKGLVGATLGLMAVYFIFETEVMDYFVDDMEPLEQSPLRQMAQDCELMAFKHNGFWQSMDTIRDRNMLDDLCEDCLMSALMGPNRFIC